MNRNILIIILLSLFGCKGSVENNQKASFSLKDELTGEWQNVSINIEMHSVSNTSVDSTIEVDEGQWEEVLGIKPIRTTFKGDGTFLSEYRDLSDSVAHVTEGTWQVEGDTLAMTENSTTTKYKTKINGNLAEFTGYLDWDQDGNEDDLYFGVQRKGN